MKWLFVAPLVVGAACYSPNAPVGAPCGPEFSCPAGQVCSANVCVVAGGGGSDAATHTDARLADADRNVDASHIEASHGDARDTSAVAALSGQRWLLPCTSAVASNFCNCATAQQTVTLSGSGATYTVTVRIRGVVEEEAYSGGTQAGGDWHVGGTPNDTFRNYYRMTVSSPAGV